MSFKSALKRRANRGRSKKQFVEWLKQHEPFIYRVAKRRIELQNPHVAGMGAIDWGGLFNSAVTTIKEVAPTYLQAKQQKAIMDMQMKRAAQGLPPADVQAYTPAIKIAPEITPDTERAITRVASDTLTSGLTKLAIPAALVGLFLLLKKRR